jgi:hypothetical protein
MNLFELLATPKLCEVRLLDKYPESSDPSTWSQITWPNYTPIMTVVQMDPVTGQGGLISCNVPFIVTSGFYLAKCWGVLYQGQFVFIGELDPEQNTLMQPGGNLLMATTIVLPSRFLA